METRASIAGKEEGMEINTVVLKFKDMDQPFSTGSVMAISVINFGMGRIRVSLHTSFSIQDSSSPKGHMTHM